MVKHRLIMFSCMRLPIRLTSSASLCRRSHLRLASSISAASSSTAEAAAAADSSPATVQSFDEIPGPKGLPVIGNVWRYLPVIGEFQLEKLDDIGRTLHQRYGPIVREHVFGHLNIVHLFDPLDMEVMFRNEGRYPERRSHRALGKYRTDRQDLYSSGGIFCEYVHHDYDTRARIARHGSLLPPALTILSSCLSSPRTAFACALPLLTSRLCNPLVPSLLH